MKNFIRRQSYVTWVSINILGCVASCGACDQHGHEHSRKLDADRTTNIKVHPREPSIEVYSNRHNTIDNPNYEDEYRDVIANKQIIYGENDIDKQLNTNNLPNEHNIIKYVNFKDGYGRELHNYINTQDHQHNYITNGLEKNSISDGINATTIYLAGYDDQIINLMNDIQKQGKGCEVLIHFYLYTNYSFRYIGYIFTNKKILRDCILKYTHYFCVGHNEKDCLCIKNLEKPSKVQIYQEVNSKPEFNHIAYLDTIPGKYTEPEINKFGYIGSTISGPKLYYPEKQSSKLHEFILSKEKDTNFKDIYKDVLQSKLSEGLDGNKIIQDIHNINNAAEHKVDIINLSDNNVVLALPELDQQNIDSNTKEPEHNYILTNSVNTDLLNNDSNYAIRTTDQKTNQENTLVCNLPNINLPEPKTSSESQSKPSSYDVQEYIPNNQLIYDINNTKPADQMSSKVENSELENMISKETAHPINVITEITDETNMPKIEKNKNPISFVTANILNQVVGNSSDVTNNLTPVLSNEVIEMTPEIINIENIVDLENETNGLKTKSNFVTVDNYLNQDTDDTTGKISNMQLIYGSNNIKPEDQISPSGENLESKDTIARVVTANLITKPNQTVVIETNVAKLKNNENGNSGPNANILNQVVSNNSDVNNSVTPVQLDGVIKMIPNSKFANIIDDAESTKLQDENISLNPVPSNEIMIMTPEVNNIENIVDLENDVNGLKDKSNFEIIDNNANQNTDYMFTPSTPPSRILSAVQDILIPNIAKIVPDTEPTVTVKSGTINNKEKEFTTYVTNLPLHNATIPSIITKEDNTSKLLKLSPVLNIKSQGPCYKFVNQNHYNIPNFGTNIKEVTETYAHHNNDEYHLKTQPYNNINNQLISNGQYPHIHPWIFLQNGNINEINQFDTFNQWPNNLLHPMSGIHGHNDSHENKLYDYDLAKLNINQNKNPYTLGPLKYVLTPNLLKPPLSKYKNIVKYLEPVASKKAESILNLPQVNLDSKHNNQNLQEEIVSPFRKESLMKTLDNSEDYEDDQNQIGIPLSDKSKEYLKKNVNCIDKLFEPYKHNTISSPTTFLPYYPYSGKTFKKFKPDFGSNTYYVLDPCAYKNVLTLHGYDKPTVEMSNNPATPQKLIDTEDTLLVNYNAPPNHHYVMEGFVPTNDHLHIPSNIPFKLNTEPRGGSVLSLKGKPINQYYMHYLSNLPQVKKKLTPLTNKVDLTNKDQYALPISSTKPIDSSKYIFPVVKKFPKFVADNNILKIEDNFITSPINTVYGVTNNVLQKYNLIEPIIKYINKPQTLGSWKSITPETLPLIKVGSNGLQTISQPYLRNYKPSITSKPSRNSFTLLPSKLNPILSLNGFSQPDSTVAPKTEPLAKDFIATSLPNNVNSIPISVNKALFQNISPTVLNPYYQKVESSLPKFLSRTMTGPKYLSSSFSVTPMAAYYPFSSVQVIPLQDISKYVLNSYNPILKSSLAKFISPMITNSSYPSSILSYYPFSSVPVIPLQNKTTVSHGDLSTNSLLPQSIADSSINTLFPCQSTPNFFESRPYIVSKDEHAPKSKFISYHFPPKEDVSARDKQNPAADSWIFNLSNLKPFASKAFANENLIGTTSVLPFPTTIAAKHIHTPLLSNTASFKPISSLEVLLPSKQPKTVSTLVQEAKDTYKPCYSDSITPTQPSKASSNYETSPYNIMPLTPYQHHSKIPAFCKTLQVTPTAAYYDYSVPVIPLQDKTIVSYGGSSLPQSAADSSINTIFQSTPKFFQQKPYTSRAVTPKTEPWAQDLIVAGLPNNFDSIPKGINKPLLQNVSPIILKPYHQKVISSLPKFTNISPTITDSTSASSSFSDTPMAADYDSSINTLFPCQSTLERPYVSEDKYDPKYKFTSYLFPSKQRFSTIDKQSFTTDSQNNNMSNLEPLSSNDIINESFIGTSSVLPLSTIMPAKANARQIPLLNGIASFNPISALEALLPSKQCKIGPSSIKEGKDKYEPTPCYRDIIMPIQPLKATSSYVSCPFSIMPLIPHHHPSKIPFYKALPHNIVSYVNEIPSNSISFTPELSILPPSLTQDTKSSKDTYPYLSHILPIDARLSSNAQPQSTVSSVPYPYRNKYSTFANPLPKSIGTNILASQNLMSPKFFSELPSVEKPQELKSNLDTKYIRVHSPYHKQLPSIYGKKYELPAQTFTNSNILQYGLPARVTYTKPASFHQTANIGSSYPKLGLQSNLPTIPKLGFLKSPIFSLHNLPNLKSSESYNTSGYKTPNLTNNKMLIFNPSLYSQSEIVSTPKSSNKIPYSTATSNSILPIPGFKTSSILPFSSRNKLNELSSLQESKHFPSKPLEISLSQVSPSDLMISPSLANGSPLNCTKLKSFDLASIPSDNLRLGSLPSGFHSHVNSPINFSPNKLNNMLSSLLPHSGESKNEKPLQNLTPISPNPFVIANTPLLYTARTGAIDSLNVIPPSAFYTGLQLPKSISKPILRTQYSSPCHNNLPSNMYYTPEITKKPLDASNFVYQTDSPVLKNDYINTHEPNLSFSNLQDSQPVISPILNRKTTYSSPMANDAIAWANLGGDRKITSISPYSYLFGIKSDSAPLQPALYPLPSPTLSGKVPYSGTQVPLSLTGYLPFSCLTTPFIQKPNFIPDVTDSKQIPTYVSSIPSSPQIPSSLIGYSPFSSLTTPPPCIQKPRSHTTDYTQISTKVTSLPHTYIPTLDAKSLGETQLKSNYNPALLSSTYIPYPYGIFTMGKETVRKLHPNNYYQFATPLTYGNVYQNDQIVTPTIVENLSNEAYTVNQPYLNTLEKAKVKNVKPPNLSNIDEINNNLNKYIKQTNVLTDILNEKIKTIHLNNIGAIQYQPEKFGKVNYLKTDNPDIYLQMWPTAVKIVKAKIMLETDELQALNFCPVVNYNNTLYTNEEIQRIIERYVKMYYGEPIIVKTGHNSHNPHVVVDNIDESCIKNGTVYIVWANTGC